MNVGRIASLIAIVLMMTLGQVLFKLAAGRIGVLSADWDTVRRIVLNPYLISGAMVYGVTTVLWVLVLANGDLSRSYPFVALTFVLVPLAGVFLFNEVFAPSLVIGGAIMLIGLAVIALG